MKKILAYCPAAIGFIFKACPHKNLLKMGSVGIGATVNLGATVLVEKSKQTDITFNQEPIRFPTVLTVIKSLTSQSVRVSISSPLPLGFGFGLSGASALATAYAVNRLLGLNKSEKELAELAHLAEIINKTGLGSVGTQTTGGFLIKTAPGIPVLARKLPLEGKKLYAIIIGRLLTPSILKDHEKMEKINTVAAQKMEKINRLTSLSLESIFDIAYEFVRESRLANSQVTNVIERIKKAGGHATMAILGHVIFSNLPPLDNNNYQVNELTITEAKATLLPL